MQLIYSGLYNGCTCKSGFFLCIFVIILFILPPNISLFNQVHDDTALSYTLLFCKYVLLLLSIFYLLYIERKFQGQVLCYNLFYKEMQTENQLKFSTINCQGLGDMNKRRDVFNYLRRKELQCLFPTRQSLYI